MNSCKPGDLQPGDVLTASGTLHYHVGSYATEHAESHFHDPVMTEKVSHDIHSMGIECDREQLTVLAADDEYIILQAEGLLGAFLTSYDLVNDYLTILETDAKTPSISLDHFLDFLTAQE